MDASDNTRIGRRAVLGAAVGGAAAAAAAALVAPSRVAGITGEILYVGYPYTATTETTITATGATAIAGTSDVGDGLAGATSSALKSGVYGRSADVNGFGVFGRNDGNLGVGALGASDAAISCTQGGAPLALHVTGKAGFSRSGVSTIPKNVQKIKLPATGITAASFGLATVQQLRTNLYVESVYRSGSSLYARLNRKAPSATTIAWIVFERPEL